jgi:hypothetical protein
MPICFVSWKDSMGTERDGAVVAFLHHEALGIKTLWAVVMSDCEFFEVRADALKWKRW